MAIAAVSGQRSAVSGQRSAVSGQRSAVSGQRSAVSGQREKLFFALNYPNLKKKQHRLDVLLISPQHPEFYLRAVRYIFRLVEIENGILLFSVH
ncbi:MAG: hypothetical protein R3281_09750 [Balneolaceae bacterium]|nr:hypothetical protein [Balneolaceae bacterium]